MTSSPELFSPRGSTAEIEEGDRLSPKFDAAGLITAVTTDAETGEVLMVAHMNAQALALATPRLWSSFASTAIRMPWCSG